MLINAALAKPIADAILAGLKKIHGVKVKKNAITELSEVIRSLLQINPDLTAAEVKIQTAKALGVISKELVLAEKMLASVRSRPGLTLQEPSKKYGHAAAKPVAKKAIATKKPTVKKAVALKKTVAAIKKAVPKSNSHKA